MRKKSARQYQTPKRAHNSKSYKTAGTGRQRGLGILILVAFFAIIFYAFLTGNKSVLKLYTLHQERNELVTEKERLIVENKELEEEIQKLQTDKRYIEEVARKKYNFKKKNEEVISIKAE